MGRSLKPMKISAAVLRGMGRSTPYSESKPFTIESVDLAAPQAEELLVRILAAGLCHSDLSVINGSRPRPMPMILGHEATGEVIEAGPGVTAFRAGDRVVFSFIPNCGHCEPCSIGRPALCEPGASANITGTLLGGFRRLKDLDGETIHHHLGISAFSDYAVVSTASAVKIDSDIPPEIAALFGCAVMTGVGAIVNTAKISPGESIAIFGLGGVGLSALLGAHAAGAFPIIAVDVNESKLSFARELGATACFNAAKENVLSDLRDFTGGGVHYAIESVGSERALAQAYAATRRGGTTVTIGLPPPERMLSIPAISLVAEERTLKGSYMGSSVPMRDIPRFINLYRAGLLPVDRLLTHRLRLPEINLAFDRLAQGEAVRQVLLF